MADQDAFYVDVGNRIRKARKKRKMTQETLAEILSLTRTSITNIEQGRQKILLHTFAALAESLNVDISTLLPDKQEDVPDNLHQVLSQRPESERKWIEEVVRSVAQKESKQ